MGFGMFGTGDKDDDSRKITPRTASIHRYIRGHNSALIGELLHARPESVHVTDKEGRAPLHTAIEFSTCEITDLLLEYGADINTRSGNYNGTGLHHAAQKGREHIVRLLLEHGADVNSTDDFHRTLLHLAAAAGHRRVVEILIDHGANLEIYEDYMKNTPLIMAAEQGHADVIMVLLKNGANPHAHNEVFANLFSCVSTGNNRVLQEAVEIYLSNPSLFFKEGLGRQIADSLDGDMKAKNDLGMMYHEGWGVEQDYREARRLFEEAAAQGDAGAMNNLGIMWVEGRCGEQSYEEARRWFEAAAAGGNVEAMNNLGMLYEKGLGVEKNISEASRWYRLADDNQFVHPPPSRQT